MLAVRFLYNSLLFSQLTTVYCNVTKTSQIQFASQVLPQEKAMPGWTLLEILEVCGQKGTENQWDREMQRQKMTLKATHR